MGSPSENFEWLGPAEAVLRRPDMYVGSIETREEHELLFVEGAEDAVEATDWSLSPIFRKIFDEVFVNALDAASRDDTVRKISVVYEESGTIVVENDGRGIPIKHFKDTGRYIPEVVFSELNAGSNFEDVGRRLGGGRNGVGVVCANVWSTSFSVEVHDGENQASYAQTFSANMRERSEPEVRQRTGRRRGSVTVRFVPDYARLGIDFAGRSKLLRSLVFTRCREGAVCVRAGVAVLFGGVRLPDALAAYASALFRTPAAELAKDEAGSPGGPHLSAVFGRRGEAAGESVAFVNGVRCCQGTHTRHVLDRVCRAAQGKAPRDVHVRPQTVRDVVGFVAVCRIPDPAFSGQAKESLTTAARSFGFTYEELAPRVVTKLHKQGVFDEIFRRETERDIASTVRKTQVPKSKEVLVDKYDPALLCRTDPLNCTLILTEGDSAKALVVAGLSVVGREHYGVFPLRGVPLNVRNVPVKKCLENKEIANVMRILNIAPGRPVEALRYGRVAIMSDQDLDGSHIAALIINFVHCLVPTLLETHPDFLCRIVTPLLRATHTRTGDVMTFFSQQELDEWLQGPDRAHYRLKYYKGLGTNSALEAKEIFSQLERHTVTLVPTERTEAAVLKFFDVARVAERKEMLTDSYDPKLCVDYTQDSVDIDAFLDREVVHFSQYHVRRALASAVDGLTPARRKVLFYFLSLPAGRETRVAQAAAGVSQKTCYHHGEASLVECIVGSAQDHVGTNNVALLEPLGQFGSRHDKPSTHAAARYIYTRAAPVARSLFPPEDGPVLDYAEEEDIKIEPVHYVPVIPVVLLNGTTGIGTGFSTSVPSFSLESLCAAARALMRGEPAPALTPHFEGFRGTVEVTPKGVRTTGALEREDDTTVVVTELPVGRWTETLLSEVKGCGETGAAASSSSATGGPNKALQALPPVAAAVNLSTDTRVRVRVTFSESIADKTDEQLAAAFKLSTVVPSTFMYLFDAEEKLVLFQDYSDILRCHAAARLLLYRKRRDHQLEELRVKGAVLSHKARFVRLVVEGTLELRGQSEAVLVAALEARGLAAIPASPGGAPSHDHLLDMSFRVCTAEHIAKLEAEIAKQSALLETLEGRTPADLWELDLQRVEAAHKDYLKTHAARHADGPQRRGKAAAAVPVRRKRAPASVAAPKAKKALRAG